MHVRRWSLRHPEASRRIPLVVGVTGGILALVAIITTLDVAPFPRWLWLPMQLAGFSFTLSGVVLWLRRPANGTGRLMALVGLTWYIGDLQLSPVAALFAVGFCLYYLTNAVMGHLVLALPTGRLKGRFERRVIATQYVTALITQTVRYVVEYPPQPQAWGDPHAVYSPWAAVGSLTMMVLTLFNVSLVIRHWSMAGAPVRREYALVWMTVTAMAFVIIANTVGALLDAPLTVQRLMQLGYSLGLVLTPITLGAGLLRVRMARVRVADLIVHLERSAEPEHVQRAIAHALGDPALEVCFPLSDHRGYVRSDGARVELPRPADRTVTPVARRGKILAVLVYDRALEQQRPLVEAVLATARLALDNARLLAAQRAQLDELRASRARIILAADTERRRVQRDLHDGVQHKLLVISMLMDRARLDLTGHGPADLVRSGVGRGPVNGLATAARLLRETIHDLRVLTEGIHPPALAEHGLAAAVEVLAERAPLPIRASVSGRRWPEHLERAAYFVITEALGNIYKHASASRAWIRVGDDPRQLVLEVGDDGLGGADPTSGTGLRGLQDRVAALDGVLLVESRPGHGTRVIAEFPCA
ncbi:MAG: hypothetical protein QOJ73_2632 [Streptosporangiaceae bacterium]|jgi:signal transduction histidine kinase|nr:hypothetical protein [Streptosporangiaceae bacterium]